MRKAQGYNRWTTRPSHGVKRRRRMHVALQLFVLGIPIVLVITLAFFQLHNRLEALLDQEKSNQYQNQSKQCADLLFLQLQHDQQHLVSLTASLSSHSESEVLAVLSALEDPELSYQIGTSSTASFLIQEGMVIFQEPFSFADGTRALLQRRTLASDYQKQIECPATQAHTTMIWADERGSIIWKFTNDELVESGKASLGSLVPSWQAGSEESTHILGNGWYVSIHSLGGDYGYFFLEREDTLLRRSYLTILQSSLSIAILVMLILLVLLFFLIYRDHMYEKSLMRLAFEDELTGLPNKNHFVHEASQLLLRSRSSYAVIVIDIGKFKLINNQFGYTFGDTLLMYIAKILPRFTTQDGVCARLSGDKFILLCSYRERKVLEKRIAALYHELKQFTFPHASPFQLDILIGISLIEDGRTSIDAAIDCALFALSSLKGKQSSGWNYYDLALKEQLLEESELEKVFTNALKEGQFFIMLQPKYSLSSTHLVGAEALVRWNHPTKGLVPPTDFINLLETHNLLVTLDMYVLEQVCKLLTRWKAEQKPLLPISVNQSRSHLFSSNYERTLVNLVDQYGIDHHLIEFELTESLFTHDIKHLSHVMENLRKHGFLVSLDDFGSGYSSLTMLKDVTIDVLKLDQGFLKGADDHQRGKVVVEHIISMAKSLGITTVAEGVETLEQVQMLTALGCDAVQGFYFSQPLSITNYEALLIDDRPRSFS